MSIYNLTSSDCIRSMCSLVGFQANTKIHVHASSAYRCAYIKCKNEGSIGKHARSAYGCARVLDSKTSLEEQLLVNCEPLNGSGHVFLCFCSIGVDHGDQMKWNWTAPTEHSGKSACWWFNDQRSKKPTNALLGITNGFNNSWLVLTNSRSRKLQNLNYWDPYMAN